MADGPATTSTSGAIRSIALSVGALADDDEVLPGRGERADQPVDVASDAAAVGRDGRCVEENPWSPRRLT